MSGADLRRRSALLAGLALPLSALAQGAFDRPPPPGPALPLPRPKLAEARLPNGLRLLVAERRGLPLVSLRLLLPDLGSLGDPAPKAGLAQMHLQLLGRGAARDGEPQNADELAFAAESLGASLELDSGLRAGSLGLTVVRKHLEPALELLADLVLNPLLTADDLDRVREELLDAREQQLADPAQLASLLARRLHWGQSAAGQLPTPASLRRIQRRDLLEQQRRLRPEASCLLLTGDIDIEEALALARQQFGDWRNGSGSLPARPSVQPMPLPARTLLVDWPGAAQAAVALAAPHAGAGELDAEARLALAVLGQGYSSRLNQELRIRRGLSYGVSCEAESVSGAGLVLAGLQTRPAQAAEAVALLGAELLRMGQEPVAAPELQARRSALLGEHGRQLETTAGLAGLLAGLALDAAAPATLESWPEALQAVPPEALQAYASRHWRADAFRRVVVADLAAAGAGLRRLDPGAWVIPRQRLDPASPKLRLG